MKVRFRRNWMPPPPYGRFRKGVQDVPNELLSKLPSTAEIVDGVEEEPPVLSLVSMDARRAALEDEARVHAELNQMDQSAALAARAEELEESA